MSTMTTNAILEEARAEVCQRQQEIAALRPDIEQEQRRVRWQIDAVEKQFAEVQAQYQRQHSDLQQELLLLDDRMDCCNTADAWLLAHGVDPTPEIPTNSEGDALAVDVEVSVPVVTFSTEPLIERQCNGVTVDPRTIALDTVKGFTIRTANILERAGYRTLGEVADRTTEQLEDLTNWSTACTLNVSAVLAEYGLSLKGGAA